MNPKRLDDPIYVAQRDVEYFRRTRREDEAQAAQRRLDAFYKAKEEALPPVRRVESLKRKAQAAEKALLRQEALCMDLEGQLSVLNQRYAEAQDEYDIMKVNLESTNTELELVEMEVRELLSSYDYDGDNIPFVKGSALCALNGTNPEIGHDAMEQLVAAMDEHILEPEREAKKDFLMSIESSVNIPGRGCVVTGTIEQGKAKLNDEVQMIGIRRKPTVVTITGIETFHKQLDTAEAGDNVGVLLRGVTKEQIKRGMCLSKPNSMSVRRNCKGEIYVLKPDEGGRSKPFFTGYRPQCFIRTADVAVDVTLPADVQMGMPGDNITVEMKLNYPLPILQGQRFALREGGKTVAAGVITELLEDSEADIKEEEERLAKSKATK